MNDEWQKLHRRIAAALQKSFSTRLELDSTAIALLGNACHELEYPKLNSGLGACGHGSAVPLAPLTRLGIRSRGGGLWASVWTTALCNGAEYLLRVSA